MDLLKHHDSVFNEILEEVISDGGYSPVIENVEVVGETYHRGWKATQYDPPEPEYYEVDVNVRLVVFDPSQEGAEVDETSIKDNLTGYWEPVELAEIEVEEEQDFSFISFINDSIFEVLMEEIEYLRS